MVLLTASAKAVTNSTCESDPQSLSCRAPWLSRGQQFPSDLAVHGNHHPSIHKDEADAPYTQLQDPDLEGPLFQISRVIDCPT